MAKKYPETIYPTLQSETAENELSLQEIEDGLEEVRKEVQAMYDEQQANKEVLDQNDAHGHSDAPTKKRKERYDRLVEVQNRMRKLEKLKAVLLEARGDIHREEEEIDKLVDGKKPAGGMKN